MDGAPRWPTSGTAASTGCAPGGGGGNGGPPPHPAPRNVLTRALGTGENAEVEVFPLSLESGDRLLLCTDGLSALVDDTALAGVITESPTPASAARHLLALADAPGAPA